MALPNYNPSNALSVPGIIQEVLKNYGLTLECCMPAVVVSYNRGAVNTAVVQPAINMITTSGEIQQRNTLELPVHVYGGGGIVISTPLKAGDTGWIIGGDRDISLFKQSLLVSNPNTYRTHQFGFGFFIPDKISGFTVSEADNDAFLIQTLSGDTKIALKEKNVTVITSGDLTATASGVTITGDSITINGTVTVTGDVIANGISLTTHVHGGVTSGSGTTGAPQ